MLSAVIFVLASTGGPNSHVGTLAWVAVVTAGVGTAEVGAEGFEQDTATTATHTANSPIAMRLVSLVFIFQIFPETPQNTSVDLVAIWCRSNRYCERREP